MLDDGKTRIMVALNIATDNQAEAVEVAEQLSRSAVGFGLRGMLASLSVTTYEEDEE